MAYDNNSNYCTGKPISLKFFQVVLTLFYGQFMSNGIFDNFILTIPELSEDPSWYHVVKVILGVIIFGTSIFSLIVVWMKFFRLIFLSGIILLLVHVTTIVITTVSLTLDYEKKSKADLAKLVAEVTVESIFQMIGIIATFFMASRRGYVPPVKTIDGDLKRKLSRNVNRRASTRSEMAKNQEDYDYELANYGTNDGHWEDNQNDLEAQYEDQAQQQMIPQVQQQQPQSIIYNKNNQRNKSRGSAINQDGLDLDF